MKLTSVSVQGDIALGDFNIEFFKAENKQVHYLVGNNGSGKTRFMDLIHQALTRKGGGQLFGEGQKVRFEIDRGTEGSLFLVHERIESNRWDSSVIDASGESVEIQHGDAPLPVVYLPTESIFKVQEIKAVTGDIPEPSSGTAEKATNLNQFIPQLLVDLKNMDAADLDREFQKQGGQIAPGTNPVRRMDRFQESYEFLMGGSKIFKEVRAGDGKHRVLFEDAHGMECDLDSLSSGEKQIVFRLGFILAHLEPSTGGLVLIDEPELSLHPTWQTRYIEAIRQMFTSTELQIIVATHSPFIFESFDPVTQECLRVDRSDSKAEPVELTLSGIGSPASAPLVAYKALDVWTEALHIELFDYLLKKTGCNGPTCLNRHLKAAPHNLPSPKRSVSGAMTFANTSFSAYETLPVWVRNHLHHRDCTDRQEPTPADKKQSVELMLRLLA